MINKIIKTWSILTALTLWTNAQSVVNETKDYCKKIFLELWNDNSQTIKMTNWEWYFYFNNNKFHLKILWDIITTKLPETDMWISYNKVEKWWNNICFLWKEVSENSALLKYPSLMD